MEKINEMEKLPGEKILEGLGLFTLEISGSSMLKKQASGVEAQHSYSEEKTSFGSNPAVVELETIHQKQENSLKQTKQNSSPSKYNSEFLNFVSIRIVIVEGHGRRAQKGLDMLM